MRANHFLFISTQYNRTMYKTILTIALLLVLVFPIVTSATTTQTGFEENTAQAYFSSSQGCEDVVVGVSIVEPEEVTPKAPLVPIQAFIFGSFHNTCDIGADYAFADVVELSNEEFDQDKLKSAFLNLTTNIAGFNVSILLDWEGEGKIEKYRNKIRIVNDSGITHDSDIIYSRESEISGTFLINGINYALGNVNGSLSTTKARTVQIEK
jgi:hypothetical protein